MLWFYLALLATVLWSFSNIIDKYVISEFLKKPIVNVIIAGLLSMVAAVVVAIFYEITLPSTFLLLLYFVTGAIFTIALFLYFRAILEEEISRTIPLLKLMPIFVLIFATIFLGEILSPFQYIGIFLAVFGSLLISVKKEANLKLSKSFWFMCISALLFASTDILTKYFLNFSNFWNVFFWIRLMAFLTSAIVLVFYYKRFIAVVRTYKRASAYAVVSEFIGKIGILIFTIALSVGFVSLASSVTALQPFFVLLIATALSIYRPQIIKEELKKSVIALKVIAILLIFVGVFLLF